MFGVVPSTCISVLFFLHMSLSFHPTRLCSTISHPMPVSPSYPFFFSRLPLIIFSVSCPLQMFISSVAFIHTPPPSLYPPLSYLSPHEQFITPTPLLPPSWCHPSFFQHNSTHLQSVDYTISQLPYHLLISNPLLPRVTYLSPNVSCTDKYIRPIYQHRLSIMATGKIMSTVTTTLKVLSSSQGCAKSQFS